MADAETEAEWAKMRSIEKERQKAVKNSEKAKPDLSALSCLDPKPTKVKGFSKDINVIMMTVEKFANISVIFVVAGVVLGLIGGAGEALLYLLNPNPKNIWYDNGKGNRIFLE